MTTIHRSATQIVQETLQKFGDGNIDGILDNCTSDVEWSVPRMENVAFAGVHRGKEGVRKFFSLLSETQIVRAFEPREFIAQGDKVVVLGSYAWTVRQTGRPLEGDWAHVWTIRDGKVAGFFEYTDTAAASAAHRG